MTNFVELLKDVLSENDKTINDLENAGIIPERSFYEYETFTPFLPTILRIANYLKVSLDYFVGKSSKNNYKKYKIDNIKFYEHLCANLKALNITKSKFANDLGIGRPNFTYWKNGSLPKLKLLIEISNYLGCDIDELLETE